jgi:hypothetical protein
MEFRKNCSIGGHYTSYCFYYCEWQALVSAKLSCVCFQKLMMLTGQGLGKRFALNVVLVLCLVVHRIA